MESILLICDNKEFEKEFIKNYLYGINYSNENNKYIGQNEVVTVVKPYQILVGYRVHRVFIDKDLELNEEYTDHVKGAIVQNSRAKIEYI